MKKESYYEMCEALGTKPKDEEIPVEYSDLPYEIQTTLEICNSLQDNYDSFNGTYLGKNYSNIRDLFEIYGVDASDQKLMYEYLLYIDRLRKKTLNVEKPQGSKKP